MATMDSNTLRARLRGNNPNVRQQRRANKKPRKAAPTVQPQNNMQIGDPIVEYQQPTRNQSLDMQVDRMRQPSPAPTGLTQEAVEPSITSEFPDLMQMDPKTRAMIMGSILKEFMAHPELLDELP